MHDEDMSEKGNTLVLKEVTPLSLGICVCEEGFMSKVIERNTEIPVKTTLSHYCTSKDYQTQAYIAVSRQLNISI